MISPSLNQVHLSPLSRLTNSRRRFVPRLISFENRRRSARGLPPLLKPKRGDISPLLSSLHSSTIPKMPPLIQDSSLESPSSGDNSVPNAHTTPADQYLREEEQEPFKFVPATTSVCNDRQTERHIGASTELTDNSSRQHNTAQEVYHILQLEPQSTHAIRCIPVKEWPRFSPSSDHCSPKPVFVSVLQRSNSTCPP